MRSLVKKILPFFYQESERIETPIWGRVPLNEMNNEQIIQFVDEFSDSMVALSMAGFSVIYDMVPKEPVVLIRAEVKA